MSRFFFTLLLPLLLLGSFGFAPIAHAQDADADIGGFYGVSDAGGSFDQEIGQGMTSVGASNASGPSSASSKPTTLPENPPGAETYNSVIHWILKLFSWLLGVAVVTLDNAVYYTVVAMGHYVSELSAVGVAWHIVRDIGNILLIFGFLAAGLATILQVPLYGWNKNVLPKLLMAAVLMNFSLFAVQAVIDTGNLFATQFYTQINGGRPPAPVSFTTVQENGIASKVMSQLGLQRIYGDTKTNESLLTNSWVVGFLGIILFITAAFVFFSLAFIFIARFVFLIYLIVLSPLGFAGWVMPKMSSMSARYWHDLLSQTVTAPVLLLLLYIALAVITDKSFLTGFGVAPGSAATFTGLAGDMTNPAAGAGMLLSFIVAMGLLLAVTMAAKKLSAKGADSAIMFAGKASFGATAWAGRGLIGTGVGRGLLNNSLVKRGAVSQNRALRYFSRGLAFSGRQLQNRTYDVRNAPAAGSAFGAFSISPGAPSKLTSKHLEEKKYGWIPVRDSFRNAAIQYDKDKKELDKKKAIADPSSGDFAKTIGKMSADELVELRGIRKGQEEFVKALAPAQYSALMKSDKLLGTEKKNISDTYENKVLVPGATNFTSRMKSMSVDDLAALTNIQEGKKEFVETLSVAKYNDLMKGTTLSDIAKGRLKSGWEDQFVDAVATATTLSRLSTDEIASLGGSILTKPHVVEKLGQNEFEAIRRKGNLTTPERHAIFAEMRDPRHAGAAFDTEVTNYFSAARDRDGNRDRYWNV